MTEAEKEKFRREVLLEKVIASERREKEEQARRAQYERIVMKVLGEKAL